jgi:hypothetical protein
MLFFNKPLPTYQFVSQNLCLHRRFERSAVFFGTESIPWPRVSIRFGRYAPFAQSK